MEDCCGSNFIMFRAIDFCSAVLNLSPKITSKYCAGLRLWWTLLSNSSAQRLISRRLISQGPPSDAKAGSRIVLCCNADTHVNILARSDDCRLGKRFVHIRVRSSVVKASKYTTVNLLTKEAGRPLRPPP